MLRNGVALLGDQAVEPVRIAITQGQRERQRRSGVRSAGIPQVEARQRRGARDGSIGNGRSGGRPGSRKLSLSGRNRTLARTAGLK